MKKNLITFIATFFLVTGFAFAQKEKEVKIKTSAICEMCKERIERNLGLSKGVTASILDLDKNVVTVKYNPKRTNEEAIKQTIVKTGYDANDLVADEKSHDKLPACCQKTAEKH
tara:strand:+ start:790 stop:1131 length:342 start_codon:yes stop_codon:yes gene_type:complete